MPLSPTGVTATADAEYRHDQANTELSTSVIPDSQVTAKQRYGYLIVSALVVTAIFLLFRNLPVSSILAGDEMQYNVMSRKLPFSADWIPNYVFYSTYASTNYCGPEFYACAKTLNVLFFSICALIVFATARLFAGELVSFLLMLAFLVSPFNVYTTQFMPEIMYGAAAWALLYFFLSRKAIWNIVDILIAGAGVALLCMIKPHGVFFAAIYLCAMIFDTAFIRKAGTLAVVKCFTLFSASFLVVRELLGLAFAGKHGLSILGPAYSADATRHAPSAYFHMFGLASYSALNHVLATALIAGVPLCILLARSFRRSGTCTKTDQLNTFTAIFFIIMIVVVAAFTATVASTAPGETIGRLHTRYYNFFDFLLPLVALAEVLRRDEPKRLTRIVAGLCAGIIAVFSLTYLPRHFQQGLMDNPEIHGLFMSRTSFEVFASVNIALIVLWIFKARVAGIAFLLMQLPLALALSAKIDTRDVRGMIGYHTVYTQAGDLATVTWGKPLPEFFIAGTGVGEGFHALFNIDKWGALIEVAPNEILHKSSIPAGILDGIIIGEHTTDFPYVLVHREGPVQIIKIKGH